MDEDKNIRVPVIGEEARHNHHRVRSIIIDADQGVKALYCTQCKNFITYLFGKLKGLWEVEHAEEHMLEHYKAIKSFSETQVDQEKEFIKLVVTQQDDTTKVYTPNSASFILEDDMADITTGMDKVYADAKVVEDAEKHYNNIKNTGQFHKYIITDLVDFDKKSIKELAVDTIRGITVVVGKLKDKVSTSVVSYLFDAEKMTPAQVKEWGESLKLEILGYEEAKKSYMDGGAGEEELMDKNKEVNSQFTELTIAKVDKDKRIVYGVFLVPEKADHDGDVIAVDDVEKVAHGFIAEYRTIDEMHKDIIRADIVESAIAWEDDFDFYGKKLKKGTWFGAIKIYDKDVWEKVKSGVYQGFSVRISGVREEIKED